jgi:hypothetical protein
MTPEELHALALNNQAAKVAYETTCVAIQEVLGIEANSIGKDAFEGILAHLGDPDQGLAFACRALRVEASPPREKSSETSHQEASRQSLILTCIENNPEGVSVESIARELNVTIQQVRSSVATLKRMGVVQSPAPNQLLPTFSEPVAVVQVSRQQVTEALTQLPSRFSAAQLAKLLNRPPNGISGILARLKKESLIREVLLLLGSKGYEKV